MGSEMCIRDRTNARKEGRARRSARPREEMVNVKCGHPGCSRCLSYGVEGPRKAELCALHASKEMVNAISVRCGHPGRTKQRSYGVKDTDTKKAELCSQHATEGMVDVKRTCGHPGCSKQRAYGCKVPRRLSWMPSTLRKA